MLTHPQGVKHNYLLFMFAGCENAINRFEGTSWKLNTRGVVCLMTEILRPSPTRKILSQISSVTVTFFVHRYSSSLFILQTAPFSGAVC